MLYSLWCCVLWFAKFYLMLRLYKGFTHLLPPLFARYVRSKMRPIDLLKYADKWVVATGCTDGIGRAYTLELARRGLRRFFLIGRNKAKLDSVAEILKLKYNCEVEYRIFDFKSDDLSTLPEELSTYEIGILANFVGVGVHRTLPVRDLPQNTLTDTLKVNAMSPTAVLETVVPGMFARDCGLVVTMASIQGWRPIPNLAAYPASKAAVSFLSKCLSMENRNTNVVFQCLTPMLVGTKMIGYGEANRSDGWVVVNCDDYARQAVDILGLIDVTTGCLQHDIQGFFLGLAPFSVIIAVMPYIHQIFDKKLVALNKSS